jgi:hypothetical protein
MFKEMHGRMNIKPAYLLNVKQLHGTCTTLTITSTVGISLHKLSVFLSLKQKLIQKFI